MFLVIMVNHRIKQNNYFIFEQRPVVLTDSIQHPLGFVLPPNTNEVHGHPGGDDAEPDGALDRSLPERHDDEEEAGQHEADRQQEVDLPSEGRTDV